MPRGKYAMASGKSRGTDDQVGVDIHLTRRRLLESQQNGLEDDDFDEESKDGGGKILEEGRVSHLQVTHPVRTL